MIQGCDTDEANSTLRRILLKVTSRDLSWGQVRDQIAEPDNERQNLMKSVDRDVLANGHTVINAVI